MVREIKWGSRKIKVYFNDKKVNKYEKERGGSFIYGYVDRQLDVMYIRKEMPIALKRLTLWHELSHLFYDSLESLVNETSAELNSRFIEEIFDRNRWIRELYKKER